jgi:hypothetical protein
MISGALANMGNLNLGMICVGANDRCWCEPPLAPVATPHFAPSAMRPCFLFQRPNMTLNYERSIAM